MRKWKIYYRIERYHERILQVFTQSTVKIYYRIESGTRGLGNVDCSRKIYNEIETI